MAAPLPTTYYYSLATAIGGPGTYTTTTPTNTLSYTELSGGSYARKACAFTGTALSGLTQALTIFVVAAAPTPAIPILYGMFFDASALLTGNIIAYWELAQPYTTSLTAYPATTFNINFNTYVSTALNLALQGGAGTSGSLIDAGAQIGIINGQPLRAGCRLSISPGGSLVPHVGYGQLMGSADIQNTLFTNNFVGSVQDGMTALSGGGTAGATPTLSSYINRITTSAASGDSCILPPLLSAPVGSVVNVINDGVSISNIFADVGSSVNVSGTLTMALGVGKPATFVRVSPILWKTIPLLPS